MKAVTEKFRALMSRLPGPVQLAVYFTWGLLLGVFFHYLLYRVGLPTEPFIYVGF